MAPLNHNIKLVRDQDRDRYFSLLFASAPQRGPLAAIYGFNIALARVREIATDPFTAQLRLEWWRDCLSHSNQAAKASNDPLSTALLSTIKTYALSLEQCYSMIDARLFDVFNQPFENLEAFKNYAKQTAGAILSFACEILQSKSSKDFRTIIEEAALAQSFCGALRLLPITRARGQNYFPLELLKDLHIDQQAIFSSHPDSKAQLAIVEAFSSFAEEYYKKFEKNKKRIPALLIPAFLPIALTPYYLNIIKKEGTNVFNKILPGSLLKKQWIMTKAALWR